MINTLAGWAAVDITPDLPCWMGGYAARESLATAVHDALFARALAFGSTARPFVIVVCDLIEVHDAVVDGVRERLPDADVWVAATHTHSGPAVDSIARERVCERVCERVIDGASAAALQAVHSMRSVTATWASVPVYGVATNRDHPQTETPIELDLLCLTLDNGRATAILGSFPCHPTVLGATNLSISADLSGAFCRQLGSLFGGDAWVALATGAAGDISTRHTRRGQDFQELERLGGVLAESAWHALQRPQPVRLAQPLVEEQILSLPTRPPVGQHDVDAARAALTSRRDALLRSGRLREARTIETSLQGLVLSSRPRPDRIAARAGVLALGDVTMVGIPGELYSQLGDEIRRSRERVLLMGYTNGYIGYIPGRGAYAGGLDYEVLASRLAPGAGEELVKVATGLLAAEETMR